MLVLYLLLARCALADFELEVTIDGQARALRWAAGESEGAARSFARRYGIDGQLEALLAATKETESAGKHAPEKNATGKSFGCAPHCAVDVAEVPGVEGLVWDSWRTPSLGGGDGYDVS